jgi:hypothetical protein
MEKNGDLIVCRDKQTYFDSNIFVTKLCENKSLAGQPKSSSVIFALVMCALAMWRSKFHYGPCWVTTIHVSYFLNTEQILQSKKGLVRLHWISLKAEPKSEIRVTSNGSLVSSLQLPLKSTIEYFAEDKF